MLHGITDYINNYITYKSQVKILFCMIKKIIYLYLIIDLLKCVHNFNLVSMENQV